MCGRFSGSFRRKSLLLRKALLEWVWSSPLLRNGGSSAPEGQTASFVALVPAMERAGKGGLPQCDRVTASPDPAGDRRDCRTFQRPAGRQRVAHGVSRGDSEKRRTPAPAGWRQSAGIRCGSDAQVSTGKAHNGLLRDVSRSGPIRLERSPPAEFGPSLGTMLQLASNVRPFPP